MLLRECSGNVLPNFDFIMFLRTFLKRGGLIVQGKNFSISFRTSRYCRYRCGAVMYFFLDVSLRNLGWPDNYSTVITG